MKLFFFCGVFRKLLLKISDGVDIFLMKKGLKTLALMGITEKDSSIKEINTFLHKSEDIKWEL